MVKHEMRFLRISKAFKGGTSLPNLGAFLFMATDKKSFILYADYLPLFEGLDDDEAGRLVKMILRYVNDLNPTAPDKLTAIAFEPIKQQLKRDLKDWEDTKSERSKAGRAGGIKSGEARRKQNEAKRSKASKNEANEAVTVNVSVNDTVTGIKKESIRTASPTNDIENREKIFYQSVATFKDQYPKEMLRAFFDHWRELNKSKTKMLWELNRTWDLKLRLIRWEQNESKFNKKNNGKENKRTITDTSRPGTEYSPL